MSQKSLLFPVKLAAIAFCVVAFAAVVSAQAGAAGPPDIVAGPLVIFEGQQDVGTVLHPGSAQYDAAKGTYTLSGSGENMWFGIDDFHFAWKKGLGRCCPHRRHRLQRHRRQSPSQSRAHDSPVSRRQLAAVDVAVHGVGLTSLQFRDGRRRQYTRSRVHVSAPQTVRIEKRGDYFYAFVSGEDGKLEPAGASTKVTLTGDFLYRHRRLRSQ
jgi:TolB protein